MVVGFLKQLFFVAKENLSRLTQERLNGPPDLAVEIIS